MFRKFGLSIMFFLICGTIMYQPVKAAQIYVANKTQFNAAMGGLVPGDSLIMSNGVWQDDFLLFQATGTAENPVTLLAETPGRVILTGGTRLRLSGHYLVVSGLKFINGTPTSGHVIEIRSGSTNCRLTNTAIINYNPPLPSQDYKWVSIYGTHHRVDHCYFSGQNHMGVTLTIWLKELNGQPNYNRIDHNYFGQRAVGIESNGYETIRIGTSEFSMQNSRAIVEYNLFEQCDGEIEIISNKSCENTFRYNTFRECQGTLTLRHGNRCTVEGNFFFGNNVPNTGGVRVIGEDHQVSNNYFTGLSGSGYRAAISLVNGVPNSALNEFFQVQNAQILFNTMVDNFSSIAIGSYAGPIQILAPLNTTFANNLVNTQSAPLVDEITATDSTLWTGNLFYGADLGIAPDTGIILADPVLIFSDSLWRPGPGSPALGNASGLYADITDDIDGHFRYEIKDIGCDQYSTEPPIRRPLHKGDVGPDWFNDGDLPVSLGVSIIGSGSVLLDPPGGLYQPGTVVHLTAVADSPYTFAGWSGDLTSTSNPDSILMDADKSVTATFDSPPQYTIGIWKIGSGSVTYDPPVGPYFEGTTVRLTAVPEQDWEFSHWGGSINSTSNPLDLFMDRNFSLTVTFNSVAAIAADQNIPLDTRLYQNFPNPFNPSTTISYQLIDPAEMSLDLYDIQGNFIETIETGFKSRGTHITVYQNTSLSSGIYVYKLTVGHREIASRKLILLK